MKVVVPQERIKAESISSDIEAEDETKPGQQFNYMTHFCSKDGKAPFSGVELGFKKGSLGKEGEVAEWLLDSLDSMPTASKKMLMTKSGHISGDFDLDMWDAFVENSIAPNILRMIKVYEQ